MLSVWCGLGHALTDCQFCKPDADGAEDYRKAWGCDEPLDEPVCDYKGAAFTEWCPFCEGQGCGGEPKFFEHCGLECDGEGNVGFRRCAFAVLEDQSDETNTQLLQWYFGPFQNGIMPRAVGWFEYPHLFRDAVRFIGSCKHHLTKGKDDG